MTSDRIINIVTETTKNTKTKAYLVGGCVRDMLLGFKTKDIDVVVEGSPKNFVEDLRRRFAGSVKFTHHEKFGTYIFEFKDGSRLDVATSRSEVYTSPADLPTVKLGVPIKDDLGRRDFTVNAIAVRPDDVRRKTIDRKSLIDPFNGYSDLKNRLIRVLHRDSFIDDPTRISRAARFACRFRFTIEKNTISLIRSAAVSGCIEKLSPARRGAELIAILAEKQSGEIFGMLAELGCLSKFFDELQIEKIGMFKNKSFLGKLKELLDGLQDPQRFLTKYQFPRKIKVGL